MCVTVLFNEYSTTYGSGENCQRAVRLSVVIGSCMMYVFEWRGWYPVASICGEYWGAPNSFFRLSLVYLPLLFPSLPLEIGPLKCSQGIRGALLAPQIGSGVEPQPKSNFVHFLPPKMWHLVATILMIFLIINWPNFGQFKHKGISWFLWQIDMEIYVAA